MPLRPPRVLFCTDTFPPQVNGVSIVTALSVGGLRDRGWNCHVIAPRYPAALGAGTAHPEELTTVASTALPIYPDIRLAAPAVTRIMRAARTFKPDLIHAETEFMLGRLGQIAAGRLGVPLTTSYHTDFGKYATAYGVPWLRPMVSRYLARFHLRARRVYTPSHVARMELTQHGVTSVEVWGRGVDTKSFNPQRRSTALRDTLVLGHALTFLYVGRLAAEKNVAQVVTAFREAPARLPGGHARLVIAGAGPKEAELRAQAPNSVTFLGHLDRAQMLPALYASADAFVFASVTETLGLVVLEAMASGLPVIAIPAGGVAEHLRDGENGLATPPNDASAMADAMVRLAMKPPLHKLLAQGALWTAEALTWSAELDRLDLSYRELLAAEFTQAPHAPTYPQRAAS